ncbi:hypothetical protein EP10_002327 [Geobacillus icigianus]|uniref:Uncharacterized protein n=1 Tax=Geobacillus icigianus TaxID=1430331 RepID=A0ABU6BHK4_9BACL|nr:hypothetical protein [Geobacillus icigianus]
MNNMFIATVKTIKDVPTLANGKRAFRFPNRHQSPLQSICLVNNKKRPKVDTFGLFRWLRCVPFRWFAGFFAEDDSIQ